MNKKKIPLLILALCFACNTNPKEETAKNSPDLFGWTEENISTLKNECLDRYGKDQPDKSEKHRENYCKCFVEKIIFSVKYEQHISPKEEIITLYQEFSNACDALTKE